MLGAWFGLQVYFLKTPVATATSFVARLLRVSQKDPGFLGVSDQGGHSRGVDILGRSVVSEKV